MLFANPGISFIAFRRDRGISCLSERVFIQVEEIGKRPAAQCRGISYSGARLCLGIKKLYCLQWCVSGFKVETDPGKRLRISKKHDKQLTFIVRVMFRRKIKTTSQIDSGYDAEIIQIEKVKG